MFTSERQAFSYSHRDIDMAVENHILAKDFPQFNGSLSVWPDPQDFKALAARADAPTTLKDLLSDDTPQISLHITSFANATFVAILWPHTLMDMMSQQAFLQAWSLVLEGRETEVPPVLGAHEDALFAASEGKPGEYILKSKQLKGSSMIKFAARFAWDMLCGPTPKTRTICLPERIMASLRLQAQMDITGSVSGEKEPIRGEKELSVSGEKHPFISDGDVLTAWAIRAVATSLPRPRPMTAMHAMNARFRLPSLSRTPGVYIQNMIVPACTFLSAEAALEPLGMIALSNRQHLAEEATEAQVLASLREQYQSKDPSKLFYSDADALLMPFSNWTRADILRTVDFSAAVLRAGDTRQSRRNPPGTPIFHHASLTKQRRTTRLGVVILGKDHEENYWLTMTLPPRAWKKIKHSLQGLY
jgi:hypothetical protein